MLKEVAINLGMNGFLQEFADCLSGSANSRTLCHFKKTSFSDSGNNFYCVPPKLFNNI